MTTDVKVHVNGRYRATVTVTKILADGSVAEPETTVVEGNYDGSPNPGGEHTFWLGHPAQAMFEVREEYLGEKSVPE